MVCQFLLYNKVNQPYIYIYPHTSCLLRLPPTTPIPSLQVVTKHRADLPVLCGCFPLATDFTFGSVYMSMPLSHFIPAYLSLTPCPQVHSHVCIFFPVLPLGSSEPFFFFRFHIQNLVQHIVFVFPFLTYCTLYDRHQVPPPHYKQLNFIYFMANFPLYICATSSLSIHQSIHLLMGTQVASMTWLQ